MISKSKSEAKSDDFVKKTHKNISFKEKSRSSHLSSHSPHVSSSEWAGQRCSSGPLHKVSKEHFKVIFNAIGSLVMIHF